MKELPLSKHRRAGNRRRATPRPPIDPTLDENPRAGLPSAGPRTAGSPRTAEIVAYGLLATAVAAGVLYLDGQPPRDIAIVAGAILALLATLVLIAPRLRVPERDDVPRPQRGEPAQTHGSAQPSGTGSPVMPAPTRGSEPARPEPGTPARSATPGRRAKRGRRRR